MTRFHVQVEIQAPPERVWAVMSSIESWQEWTASITKIKRLDSGPLGVGSRALVRQPKLPPAIWKVTEWSEGNGFTWVSRGPALSVTGRHRIEPAPSGSKVELSVTYEGLLGPLLARLTGRINDRYLALEANGLKERSEA
jgi:uncharacterized membrane protein